MKREFGCRALCRAAPFYLLLGLALALAGSAAARETFILNEGKHHSVTVSPDKPITIRVTNLLPMVGYFSYRIWGEKGGKSFIMTDSINIRCVHGAARSHKPSPYYKEISFLSEKGNFRIVVHQDQY